METNLSAILRSPIKIHSGFNVGSYGNIHPVRRGFCVRENQAVSGDAPKDFLRVYEYGHGRKANPKRWPAHIAKVGHKCYPVESITEHLLTRIGQLLEMKMAASRLMLVRGQIRFLSEYFLHRNESLIHGAQIFAGYLAEDLSFVENVEELKMSNQIFTFQVVETAVRTLFKEHAEILLQDFVRLLAFDAIVGNNDRHFYNWGVVTHVKGSRPPRFSPIYDSARALLWNISEEALTEYAENPRAMPKYVRSSFPKTGWDQCAEMNHFELILKVCQERPMCRDTVLKLCRKSLPEQVENMLEQEFAGLMSPLRQSLIVKCLRMRLGNFSEVINLCSA